MAGLFRPSSSRPTISNSPAKDRQKGVLRGKSWFCNCTPPLPAVQFQVRKDSPNKGRWFYTCRSVPNPEHPETQKCGFFLWAEDARGREEEQAAEQSQSAATPRTLRQSTVLERLSSQRSSATIASPPSARRGGNPPERERESWVRRSSPASDTTTDGGEEEEKPQTLRQSHAKTQAIPSATQPPSHTGKRKRPLIKREDSDSEFSDMDSDAERMLVNLADTSAKKQAIATPVVGRRSDSAARGMPTPELTTRGARRVLFTGSAAQEGPNKRPRTDNAELSRSVEEPSLDSPQSTPNFTPIMDSHAEEVHSNSTSTPSSSLTRMNAKSLTDEVMEFVTKNMGDADEEKQLQLRNILRRHEDRQQGYLKGRETARELLRKEKETVGDLRATVAKLESKLWISEDLRMGMIGDMLNDQEGIEALEQHGDSF